MLRTALVSMMVAVPALSFAQQSNGPLTRAQVRQELVDLASVGYHPTMANDVNYPQDTQAAMARLAQKRAHEAQLAQGDAQTSYGAEPSGHVESGAPAAAAVRVPGEQGAYAHH